jgi:hypothetical protein
VLASNRHTCVLHKRLGELSVGNLNLSFPLHPLSRSTGCSFRARRKPWHFRFFLPTKLLSPKKHSKEWCPRECGPGTAAPRGQQQAVFVSVGTFNVGFFRSEGGTVKAARLPKGWTGPVSMLGTRGGIKPAPCYFAHSTSQPHTSTNRCTRQTQHNQQLCRPINDCSQDQQHKPEAQATGSVFPRLRFGLVLAHATS